MASAAKLKTREPYSLLHLSDLVLLLALLAHWASHPLNENRLRGLVNSKVKVTNLEAPKGSPACLVIILGGPHGSLAPWWRYVFESARRSR
jgi:hypothetical protein